MPRVPLSVTIITLNEERNLPRALQSVQWAEEILVIDSGSTDRTVELGQQLGARVISRPWPGYGKQKNFAQQSAAYDWVLNIDADEFVTPELAAEIQQVLEFVGTGHSQAKGFYFPRKTFYLGRWIKHGGWYPNHLVRLADRRAASWTEPTVHETLVVKGDVFGLVGALEHDSFSGIREQILTNLNFSRLGSEDLKNKGQRASLFKLLWKPLGKFLETYVMKLGFMDGLPGLIISINAAHSMFLKYAYLIEAKLQERIPEKVQNAHLDRR